jgi:hypothetical protein
MLNAIEKLRNRLSIAFLSVQKFGGNTDYKLMRYPLGAVLIKPIIKQ